MKIAIDISQTAYRGTGVANFTRKLVEHLIKGDTKNEYVLFFSSLRNSLDEFFLPFLNKKNVTLKHFKFPPTVLDILWNRLHILPVEYLIGPVDIFISSDWTEPPTVKAKKATILYDVIVYKFPQETAQNIVEVQKRRLKWVKKKSDVILCISEATKKDALKILGIEEKRLKVVYPGI